MEPITLTNLHAKSLQEVFDRVASHLLTQSARSLLPDGSGCAYRGANGRMCAVGCLIADYEYEAIDLLFRHECEPGTTEEEQDSIEGTLWSAVCRVMNRAGITRPSALVTAYAATLDLYSGR